MGHSCTQCLPGCEPTTQTKPEAQPSTPLPQVSPCLPVPAGRQTVPKLCASQPAPSGCSTNGKQPWPKGQVDVAANGSHSFISTGAPTSGQPGSTYTSKPASGGVSRPPEPARASRPAAPTRPACPRPPAPAPSPSLTT